MEPSPIHEPSGAAHPGAALRITAVYHDTSGQEWAGGLWSRLSQLMGDGAIVIHAWNLAELEQPQIFSTAAAAAAHDDVLVVSIQADERIPAALCGWIEAWLPRRQRQDGALIALIGMSAGQPAALLEKAEKYLMDVARRGRLDFLPREHVTAGTSRVSSP